MANLDFGRHKVSVGGQAIVARPEIPRSTFSTSATHKTTFDADYLYPVYCEEILPGDSLNLDVTAFVRMATPLFPLMDNLYVDTFFFFVPNRLVWDNWNKFMGEQRNPGESTDFLIPQIVFEDETIASLSIYDYMGIPPITLTGDEQVSVNVLPFRAYSLIWDEWFRDQNTMNNDIDNVSPPSWKGDGPDTPEQFFLKKRSKRHDYFTSALPWPQKGNEVSLPLSGNAPLVAGTFPVGPQGVGTNAGMPTFRVSGNGTTGPLYRSTGNDAVKMTSSEPTGGLFWVDPQLIVDLSGAEVDLTDVAAVSVNMMRSAIAMQQLLERDARFGTRYTEVLRGHFGVDPQDSRLTRPEYLGGSSTPINVTPVAQTSAPPEPGDSPVGNLGAAAVATPRARVTATFPEHGFVLGLINVRADLSYQQGLHRMWTKRTRFDLAWPSFAGLGEQAIYQYEIFLTGWDNGYGSPDTTVFGYQERYAEYRYRHSLITGKFRSGIAGTLDAWHLSQYFDDPPVLDVAGQFIKSSTPMERILAAGDLAEGQQFLADILFRQRMTRALPVHGTPGLTRF